MVAGHSAESRSSVVVTVIIRLSHRLIQIVEYYARVSVEEEARELRSVCRIKSVREILRGVGERNYRHGFERIVFICGVCHVHIEIKIYRRAVLTYAIGNVKCKSMLQLYVISIARACFYLLSSLCIAVPYCRRTVKALLGSLLNALGVSPVNHGITEPAAKVCIPVFNDLFKISVSTVLIRLPEDVAERYVVSRRNKYGIVIRSCLEIGVIREIGSALGFLAELLSGPIKIRRNCLITVQIVEYLNYITAVEQGLDDLNVGLFTYSFDIRINDVYYERSSVISGLCCALCGIVIRGYLDGNSYVSVVGYRNGVSDLICGKLTFDLDHRIGLRACGGTGVYNKNCANQNNRHDQCNNRRRIFSTFFGGFHLFFPF